MWDPKPKLYCNTLNPPKNTAGGVWPNRVRVSRLGFTLTENSNGCMTNFTHLLKLAMFASSFSLVSNPLKGWGIANMIFQNFEGLQMWSFNPSKDHKCNLSTLRRIKNDPSKGWSITFVVLMLVEKKCNMPPFSHKSFTNHDRIDLPDKILSSNPWQSLLQNSNGVPTQCYPSSHA